MSEPKKGRSEWPIRVAVWVGAAVGLLALYVLSLGPVAWLVDHGYISTATYQALVQVVYLPLTWVVGSSRWAQEFLEWYISFWRW